MCRARGLDSGDGSWCRPFASIAAIAWAVEPAFIRVFLALLTVLAVTSRYSRIILFKVSGSISCSQPVLWFPGRLVDRPVLPLDVELLFPCSPVQSFSDNAFCFLGIIPFDKLWLRQSSIEVVRRLYFYVLAADRRVLL
jgi:hypothetical protein